MAKQERKSPRDSAPMPTDLLTRKVGRFALTIAVAKRAANLIDRYGGSPDGGAGTLERALGEIASGRVKIVREESSAEPAAGAAETDKKQSRRKKAA